MLAKCCIGGVVRWSHHLGLTGRDGTQLCEVCFGILVDGRRCGRVQEILQELHHVDVELLDFANARKHNSVVRARSLTFADVVEDLCDALWVSRCCNKGEDAATCLVSAEVAEHLIEEFVLREHVVGIGQPASKDLLEGAHVSS